MKEFWIKYINVNSPQNGTCYLVREIENIEHYYFISDGKSHIGGGKLLKKFCQLI